LYKCVGSYVNSGGLVKLGIKGKKMLRLRIAEVAKQKGYSMNSLSRASDVSFNTIKRLWKKPDSGVSLETLAKIARALQVDIGELVENIPDKD
jgi:DNA-binding Xre family transcriptional regulator